MSVTLQPTVSTPLSRRQALKIAISSVLLIGGCASVSSSSDLDTAVSELNNLINEVDTDNDRTLISSIASKIKNRASVLVAEHKIFITDFERLLSHYNATENQLKHLAETYATRRRQLRDELLHLQDELHAAMTPQEWDKVVRVLNQTGKAIAAYTLTSG